MTSREELNALPVDWMSACRHAYGRTASVDVQNPREKLRSD